MARGLGSSSACIIAGLFGANKLMGDPLGLDDLVNLSAQIQGHPDNTAPALLGGIVTAVFDGREVHWVKQEVFTTLKFVVVIPDFELKTEKARAYRGQLQGRCFQSLPSCAFLGFAPHGKISEPPHGCERQASSALSHGAYPTRTRCF